MSGRSQYSFANKEEPGTFHTFTQHLAPFFFLHHSLQQNKGKQNKTQTTGLLCVWGEHALVGNMVKTSRPRVNMTHTHSN